MDLRHIVLDQVTSEYTYKGTGGGNFNSVRRSKEQRKRHGEKLHSEISDLFPDKYDDEYISEDEEGIYVEVISVPGYELSILSFDAKGSRLCNVRIDQDEVQRATIFISEEDRGVFLRKLDQYKAQGQGNTNNKLFDNVASINVAGLEQFWTSTPDSYPVGDQSIWWEVWLQRKSTDRREAADFQAFCKARGLQTAKENLEFELTTIIAVRATPSELQESTLLISCLSELRKITDTARFLLKQRPYEQAEWMDELLSRVEFSFLNNVSVLILDHGVNFNHPLLTDGIDPDACFSWSQDWPIHDRRNNHGTLQAGLTFYGDISTAVLSGEKIIIPFDIESCRILPPDGSGDKELYGSLTYFGIRHAEEEVGTTNRVISMAITADNEGASGQPTSWSAQIDQLSYNGDFQRLFVLSCGNIREWDQIDTDYKNNVNKYPVEDPGQSWNAITVGAYTSKTEVTEKEYKDWEALADEGDICPTSRTSNDWDWRENAPFKPDVVEEGGNLIVTPDGSDITNADCVSLITTADIESGHVFTDHRETSAATALVTRIVAEIWNAYPDLRAETVRALLTHSAQWTPQMLRYQDEAEQAGLPPKESKEIMLRMFGYGVPNMQRSIASARNYLTMIIEDEIKPFKFQSGSTIAYDEMKIIELPWPQEELVNLKNANCRLRATLSYFIEPNPGRKGFTDRFRYQSFGLRFKLNNPGEDSDTFLTRINKAERESRGVVSPGNSDTSGWELGDQLRTRGSLHQDTWVGSASELALRNYVGIIPVAGWWRQSKRKLYEDKVSQEVPYSLVLSLDVDGDVDIYTSVAQQVGVEPLAQVLVPAN